MSEYPSDTPPAAGKPTSADEILPPPAGAPAKPDAVAFWPLMAQLFVIPLLIVIACLGVYMLFGWMAADQRTGMELLSKIEGYAGADNKMTPWMGASKNEAALALILMLQNKDPKLYQGALVHPLSAGRGSDDREAFELALIDSVGRMRKKDPDAAGLLAGALSYIGTPAGREGLRMALASDDPFLRFEALRGLAEARDLASFSVFLDLLGDPDVGRRQLAVWAIGRLADPKAKTGDDAPVGRLLSDDQVKTARAKVRPLLDEATADVRRNAAVALAFLGDSAGVPVLLQLLEPAHQVEVAEGLNRLARDAQADPKAAPDKKAEDRVGRQARDLADRNAVWAIRALGTLAEQNAFTDTALRTRVGAKLREVASDAGRDTQVQQEAGKLLGHF